MLFKNDAHRAFFEEHKAKNDPAKDAFVYLMGLTEATREAYPELWAEHETFMGVMDKVVGHGDGEGERWDVDMPKFDALYAEHKAQGHRETCFILEVAAHLHSGYTSRYGTPTDTWEFASKYSLFHALARYPSLTSYVLEALQMRFGTGAA